MSHYLLAGKPLKNFFVLEGLDGSGKTTVMRELQKKLPEARFEKEPTVSPIGKKIRNLITDNEQSLQEESLLFLFSADRWEHMFGEKGIAYKRTEEIVICDRYLFSSLSYQGKTKKSLAIARELNRFFPLPEIVFYFQITPEEALKRIKKRNENLSRYEKIQELQEIQVNYQQIFQTFQKLYQLRIIKVDAYEEPAKLANKIAQFILKV